MRTEENRQAVIKDALKMVAPGTVLREGLENILRAKTGGLVVVGDFPEVRVLAEGGFIIDDTVNAARLYELAKMDGAIVLDEKGETIWKANVQLQPMSKIESEETGIRHRVAERTARQTGAIVIAISQRRSMISIFKGTHKFVLSDLGVLLAKSNQALQTMERYCYELRKELENLSLLEFENTVLVNDVVKVVHRSEVVRRIMAELDFYLLQMGNEGHLIQMQMDELTNDIWVERRNLLMDYAPDGGKKTIAEIEKNLASLDEEDLLARDRIAKILSFTGGSELENQPAFPHGYRILGRIPRLTTKVVDNIVKYFDGDLQMILAASVAELDEVEGVGQVRSHAIHRGLARLREQAAVTERF